MILEINNFTTNKIDKENLEKIFKQTLKLAKVKKKIEVSLAIVGKDRMRKINKIYRKKNRVTDVLAFEADKDLGGEIIICYPQVKKQAKLLNQSFKQELNLVFIHGLLHLFGFDHEKSKFKAQQMRMMEEKILKSI